MRLALGQSRAVPRGSLIGTGRFLVYLCLQFCIFTLAGPWLVLSGLLIFLLGRGEGLSWSAWIRRSRPVLLMAAFPALAGFPLTAFLGTAWDEGQLGRLFGLWLPALVRSLRFFLVFASAGWLSQRLSPVELREVLALLLRPLGRRLGGCIARSAALALAFLPWTLAEIRMADEAARLRGSRPDRKPVRHLAALAVPVSVRALEKARLSAEALELRDPGMLLGRQTGSGD